MPACQILLSTIKISNSHRLIFIPDFLPSLRLYLRSSPENVIGVRIRSPYLQSVKRSVGEGEEFDQERKRGNRRRSRRDVIRMITRHNLAEQLREYQIRSKHDWASASIFSATTSFTSRADIVIFVIWELVILAFIVLAAVSLYFRHMRLAFILVCVSTLLLVSMKIMKQVRLARKKKRRMLLPLSM